jgi:hypothetical protein
MISIQLPAKKQNKKMKQRISFIADSDHGVIIICIFYFKKFFFSYQHVNTNIKQSSICPFTKYSIIPASMQMLLLGFKLNVFVSLL